MPIDKKSQDEFKKMTRHYAQRSQSFHSWFLTYLEGHISIDPHEFNKLSDDEKLLIQKTYLHAWNHRKLLEEKYFKSSNHGFLDEVATPLFEGSTLEKAQDIFKKEDDANHYGYLHTVTISQHLLDTCVQVYNLTEKNIDHSSERYITEKDGEYYLQNEKLPFRKNSTYYQLFKIIFNHFNGKSGSLTYNELIKLSKGVAPLHTTKDRTRKQIDITIKNTLFTNTNGIRRASKKPDVLAHILSSPHGQRMIIFNNFVR